MICDDNTVSDAAVEMDIDDILYTSTNDSLELQIHLAQVELEPLTHLFFNPEEFDMMHRNHIISSFEHDNIIFELCLLHNIRRMHLCSG